MPSTRRVLDAPERVKVQQVDFQISTETASSMQMDFQHSLQLSPIDMQQVSKRGFIQLRRFHILR